MAKERKSPQQKKELEYTRDHFTPGWVSSRYFPKTWKRKKARVNRDYRRKSEEILAQAKPGTASSDVETIADDLTAARFQKSVSRKRLHKIGTITVGEKVKRKLGSRREAVGRNARRHQRYDDAAKSAVNTLTSLEGNALLHVVRRADLLCNARNEDERKRVLQGRDQIDRALDFLYQLSIGSAFEGNALRRHPDLHKALRAWMRKADRILESDNRAREIKSEQKQAVREKWKALRKP
jgi:hypothetical protein